MKFSNKQIVMAGAALILLYYVAMPFLVGQKILVVNTGVQGARCQLNPDGSFGLPASPLGVSGSDGICTTAVTYSGTYDTDYIVYCGSNPSLKVRAHITFLGDGTITKTHILTGCAGLTTTTTTPPNPQCVANGGYYQNSAYTECCSHCGSGTNKQCHACSVTTTLPPSNCVGSGSIATGQRFCYGNGYIRLGAGQSVPDCCTGCGNEDTSSYERSQGETCYTCIVCATTTRATTQVTTRVTTRATTQATTRDTTPTTVPPIQRCGDGVCSGSESNYNCPADCHVGSTTTTTQPDINPFDGNFVIIIVLGGISFIGLVYWGLFKKR